MGLEPDNLLVQTIALSYFAAGLWLVISTKLLVADPKVRHRIMIMVAVVVTAGALLWIYFFVVVLQGHIQAIHGVMLIQGLLIIVTTLSLVSMSFSAVRQRMSQGGLALLVIGLPLLYLWLLRSFGLSLFGWIPILIQTKGAVFVPILALTLYLIAYLPARWRTVAILALLLVGSLITMLGALITMAFPAG